MRLPALREGRVFFLTSRLGFAGQPVPRHRFPTQFLDVFGGSIILWGGGKRVSAQAHILASTTNTSGVQTPKN